MHRRWHGVPRKALMPLHGSRMRTVGLSYFPLTLKDACMVTSQAGMRTEHQPTPICLTFTVYLVDMTLESWMGNPI